MTEEISGKLELLFAHLSINNVRDIKPLLIDAIDEYQSIRSNLTYDQKQKVNFIKSLLYHAEREEWNQARNQLNGAQKAYQEYMSNRTKYKGYSQVCKLIFKKKLVLKRSLVLVRLSNKIPLLTLTSLESVS